jgi:hypothetical protein
MSMKKTNEQDNIMYCSSTADKFPRNETVYFLLRIGIGKHAWEEIKLVNMVYVCVCIYVYSCMHMCMYIAIHVINFA